ncbi:DNA alkylation repair protein [Marinicellulosiphila megalodicopiae]|uniref:DNA alkylation repair protein n=1 Tax=Marinicellulosiphila megalodicopiae TaxID=2724896 RepID=UPI003BB08853
MIDQSLCITYLKLALRNVSTEAKAQSSRRYFPHGINCIGANAGDIKQLIADFYAHYPNVSANEALAITEFMLENIECHEEVLVAFALINKFVKKHYNDDLLLRFEYWLEHYTNNWAQVDDLCIKTIYHFLMARPHLIEQTQHWVHSDVSWCRRASNVVWVKFIKRKIGKTVYYLDKELVFKNCDLLLDDSDEFVQKSVGWLLKATSLHHEQAVVDFIQQHSIRFARATLRYAIEKMDVELRQKILALY